MPDDTETFLTRLQTAVEDRALGSDGSAPDFKENVFTTQVMEMLAEEVGIVESPQTCHFLGTVGQGQAKINGYAIGEDAQDEESIDLFVSHYTGNSAIARVPNDEMRKLSDQALRFLSGAVGSLHQKMDPAKASFEMVRRIHEAAPKLKRARLFILTDAQSDLAKKKSAETTVKGLEIPLRVEFWDIERLARVVGSGTSQTDIEIDVVAMNGAPLPCVPGPTDERGYRTFVTIIPGSLLYKLYEEHGPALLTRNVRSFLQAKGKVNRGIRDSLKQQPERFLAYNNGISLTADSVETPVGNDAAITRITGLQIVNGGQTTASIHRAGKEKFDLSRVYVQAKLTVIEAALIDELAPKIAEFANTQNPIQMADFSANDPFHVDFDGLSKTIWAPGAQSRWFYERTRGQYSVELSRFRVGTAAEAHFKETTPKSQHLNKIDVARYLTAWEQLPQLVSLGGQKNFVFFTQRMRETKTKNWKPDDKFFKDTIAKAILYKEIVKLASKTTFSEWKFQIAAYVMAALSFQSGGHLDLGYIWQHQKVSPRLSELLSAWIESIGGEIVKTAADQARGPSEWSKRAECWKRVQKLSLPPPSPGIPEFERVEKSGGSWGVAPTEARVALDHDELDARKRCRQVDEDEWIRIVKWAKTAGVLDPKQREIAVELAGAAANGWTKDISAKKALTGREIINLAVENGVLELESA